MFIWKNSVPRITHIASIGGPGAKGLFKEPVSIAIDRSNGDLVIANSGMAIYCASDNLTLEESLHKAQESLSSGKALEALKKLIN